MFVETVDISLHLQLMNSIRHWLYMDVQDSIMHELKAKPGAHTEAISR